MDIRFLTTFLDLVETRHFGKTAENLYLTQSAVSARIKHLEEYFHSHLFIRQRNRLLLTPAGEQLIPYAKSLCATLQDARTAISRSLSEYIAFGATPLIGELMLPTILTEVYTHFSDWSVKAESMTLETLSRRLHDGSIDIALTTEPVKFEAAQNHVLVELPLAMFLPKSADLTAAKADYIGVDWTQKKSLGQNSGAPLGDKILDTNSLCIALAAQQQHQCAICLPVDTGHVFLKQLTNTYHSMTEIAPLEGQTLTIYAIVSAPIRRKSIEQALTLINSLQ